MLSKDIEYTDYNGNERKDTFYFNLNDAEIIEMEMATPGGFTEKLKKMAKTQDIPSLIYFFKDLILKSYGEKSPDGNRFVKSEELSIAFSQTEAYSKLYKSLVQDSDEAANFVNGIIPSGINQKELKQKTDEIKKAKSLGEAADIISSIEAESIHTK